MANPCNVFHDEKSSREANAKDDRRDAAVTLRTERNLTQTELSVLAGIDRKTINRIENGHFAPSVDTLVRLSMVMRVPVTDFLS